MLGRKSLPKGNERFLERRRIRRRRIIIGLSGVILISLTAIVYELWQPSLRISRVEIFGAEQSLDALAWQALHGTYLGVLPRNSTFIYPASAIRRIIMKEHPEVAAVSLFRNGFSGLSVKVTDRIGIAKWCGLAPTEGVDEYCYVFDANGYIFAPSEKFSSPINTFTLYDPLAENRTEPLGATLRHAEMLPTTFDFARQLDSFGSATDYVLIQNDEVTIRLKSGTRVLYLLGSEQNAFTALVAAQDDIDLASGATDYIDLRFGQKVYVKKIQR